MSKTINFSDFKGARDKDDKNKLSFSNKFRRMFVSILKQANRELGDKLLTVTAEATGELELELSDEEKLEVFEHPLEELNNVVDSMEYMIEYQRKPAEVVAINREEDD